MICWSAKSERGSAQRRTQQTKEACDISCLSCCPLRHDLSGGVLAEAARQDARQSIAEHPGVRRAVAVEHARFIEQQVGVNVQGQQMVVKILTFSQPLPPMRPSGAGAGERSSAPERPGSLNGSATPELVEESPR